MNFNQDISRLIITKIIRITLNNFKIINIFNPKSEEKFILKSLSRVELVKNF
jgi:hypothetical protein